MAKEKTIIHVNLASNFGGGESQTLLLIEQQLKQGYKIKIVAKVNSPFFKKAKQLTNNIIGVKNFLFGILYKPSNKSCIHCHDAKAVYFAYLNYLRSKTPYIITRRVDNKIKDNLVLKQAYKKAHAITSVSNRVKEEILKFNNNLKIKIIFDSPKKHTLNKEKSKKIKDKFKNKFLIVQAGNMLKHKGFSYTINLAKKLDKTTNIQFILLGNGPLKNQLQQQSKDLSNVHFAGKVDNIGDWFFASDLLIHPSFSEGLGSVILEAMYAKLPVLATKRGGIPEIIKHNQTGFLLENHSLEQGKKAIFEIKKNKVDTDKIIQRAFVFCQTLSIKKTALLYQELY